MTDDGFGETSQREHPWSNLAMCIRAEADHGRPAGCNFTGDPVTPISDPPVVPFSCSAAAAGGGGGGSGSSASVFASPALEYYWVTSWAPTGTLMLGCERLNIRDLSPSVALAEGWAYAQAADALATSMSGYSLPLNTAGLVAMFLTSVAATVGAWAGYTSLVTWAAQLAGPKADQSPVPYAAASAVATLATFAVTVAPFVLVLLGDRASAEQNDGKGSVQYAQTTFDEPGFGDYRLVALLRTETHVEPSNLTLSLSVPLAVLLLFLNVLAWVLTAMASGPMVEDEGNNGNNTNSARFSSSNSGRRVKKLLDGGNSGQFEKLA